MAKFFTQLDATHRAFIGKQHLFFVASAPRIGRVNVSPKGMDCMRIVDDHRLAYLDLTGSGNETAAHILDNGRITLMFCSFDGDPLILRAYGRGETVLPTDPQWPALSALFPDLPGARQIIVTHIDAVQTSCGFAVPFYQFVEHRPLLLQWATKKGAAGLATYQQEKNTRSIDGLPTPFAVS
ncbi:MAG: pyridoxamine 5'-phosphate oxidase family protein [Gammaproteobacteria bacterium]|nr:pyridoxamine 5'-phosphate oxidase family protein [Gammaproteobacteria bacterium]